MYLLLKSDGSSFQLNNEESYTIGRKETSFILEDKTVSKKHAKITVRNKNVFVQDLNSSNKTYINEKVLLPNVESQVKVGSRIKFGTQESNFILKKDDLIITMSGLSKSDKERLKKLIEKMSGSIIANWSSVCTHVVVSEIVLTVKVLSALIHKKPLVTIDYFIARLNWIENKGPPPKIDLFRPSLSEDKLHKMMTIDYDMDRTTLFRNKIFVFPNKESKKKMESIIALAGGGSISFDSDPVQRSNLLGKTVEYVFVITPENTQSEHTEFNDCVKYLMEHDRRSIPMSEIAMAILAGNCEVECNPSFNKVGHIMGGERPEIRSDVIAFETQTESTSQSSYSSNCSVQCIPSSLSPSASEPMEVESGGKRQAEEFVRDVKKSKGDDSGSRSGSSQKEVKKVQTKLGEFFKKPDTSSLSVSSRADSQCSMSDKESLNDISDVSSFSPIYQASQTSKRKSQDEAEKIPKKSKFTLSELISSTQSSTMKPIKKVETQQPSEPDSSKHSDPANPFRKIEMNKQGKAMINPFFSFKKKEPKTDVAEVTDALEKMTHKEKSDESMQSKRSLPANTSTISGITKVNANDGGSVSKKVKVTHAKENVFNSTAIDGRSVMNVTAVSNLSVGTNCNRWLNKSSASVTTRSVREDEISEDTRIYIKNFKPATVVIVSASSLIVRRPRDSTVNTQHSGKDSKLPNFKKFKKVQPLHEQTEIIPSECFITVICGEKANKNMKEFEEPTLYTQPIRKPTSSRSKFRFEN